MFGLPHLLIVNASCGQQAHSPLFPCLLWNKHSYKITCIYFSEDYNVQLEVSGDKSLTLMT